jgi:hypothetical protein
VTDQIEEELRPVLYNPADRNGFFTDVSLDVLRAMQAEDWQCSICMGGTEDGEVATLPCKHVFHVNCMKTWFGDQGPTNTDGERRRVGQGNTTCPMCRKNWKALIGVPSWEDPVYVGLNGHVEYTGGFRPFQPSDYGYSPAEDREPESDDDGDEEGGGVEEFSFVPLQNVRAHGNSLVYGGSVAEIFAGSLSQNDVRPSASAAAQPLNDPFPQPRHLRLAPQPSDAGGIFSNPGTPLALVRQTNSSQSQQISSNRGGMLSNSQRTAGERTNSAANHTPRSRPSHHNRQQPTYTPFANYR